MQNYETMKKMGMVITRLTVSGGSEWSDASDKAAQLVGHADPDGPSHSAGRVVSHAADGRTRDDPCPRSQSRSVALAPALARLAARLRARPAARGRRLYPSYARAGHRRHGGGTGAHVPAVPPAGAGHPQTPSGVVLLLRLQSPGGPAQTAGSARQWARVSTAG